MTLSCKSNHDSNPKTVSSFYQDEIPNQIFKSEKAKTLNDLAVKMSQNGLKIEAKNRFLEALAIEPNNYTILSNLGLNALLLEDYDKSIQYLSDAIKASDSTYYMAGSNLGLAYNKISNYDKSIKVLDFVIKNCKDQKILFSAYLNQTLSYLDTENCLEAKKNLYKLKQMEPKKNNQIQTLEEELKDCIKKLER